MKPLIHIDDTQIHIDDEHYTLFIRFKKQLETHQVRNTTVYPDEIIAICGNDPPEEKLKIKDLKERTCVMCEAPFKPYRVDQKYCSKKCKAAYNNHRHRSVSTNVHPLKGQPAIVGIKVCHNCSKEFKPTSNVQKFCSDLCKRSFIKVDPKQKIKTLSPERKQHLNNPKAGIRDRQELKAEKLRKMALEQSPKTDDLLPVFIDAKTTIYIKPGEDPEQARKNFIEKHNQFEKNE